MVTVALGGLTGLAVSMGVEGLLVAATTVGSVVGAGVGAAAGAGFETRATFLGAVSNRMYAGIASIVLSLPLLTFVTLS